MEETVFVEYCVVTYGSMNIGILESTDGMASMDLRPAAKERSNVTERARIESRLGVNP